MPGPFLDLTEAQSLRALGLFLESVLPAGVPVVQGQVNRVPEVSQADFVVFIPILRERLSTNVDTYADTVFTGSIVGNVLTVESVDFGVLSVGRQVFGPTVTANTFILALQSATGGVGTYILSNPQAVASGTLAAGLKGALQPIKLTVQVEVHGPAAADNTQIITTLFRDEYAFDQFAATGYDVIPLYTDDPKQMPFHNDQQQIETRWVIDAVMQCNPTVFIPQQFADQLGFGPTGLINVDVVYPPA